MDEREKKLRRLAMDCAAGLVFTDRHCQCVEDVLSSFMVLALMEQDQKMKLCESLGDRGMFYEYMSAAGPMSVNGRPTFFSAQTLNTEDADQLRIYWKEESERRQALAS